MRASAGQLKPTRMCQLHGIDQLCRLRRLAFTSNALRSLTVAALLFAGAALRASGAALKKCRPATPKGIPPARRRSGQLRVLRSESRVGACRASRVTIGGHGPPYAWRTCTCHSPFITHDARRITHDSQQFTHDPQRITHNSQLITHNSLRRPSGSAHSRSCHSPRHWHSPRHCRSTSQTAPRLASWNPHTPSSPRPAAARMSR